YPGLNSDNHSVMYPFIDFQIVRRNFSSHDSAELMHLYNHGANVDPLSPVPASAAPAGHDTASPGAGVSRGPDAFTILDEGNGNSQRTTAALSFAGLTSAPRDASDALFASVDWNAFKEEGLF